jgi:aryl-alcohol dehydrogenase-like predicted oxidoreductase
MEYRELGRTGLRLSVVGYGTAPLGDMFGNSDEETALQSAYRALDAGINFFDSSPFYGRGLAEERLGKVLRGRRHEIIVGTKAGRYGPRSSTFPQSESGAASRKAFVCWALTTSTSCNCTTSSSSTWKGQSGRDTVSWSSCGMPACVALSA